MHRDLTSFTRPESDQMIWGGVTGVKGVGEGWGGATSSTKRCSSAIHTATAGAALVCSRSNNFAFFLIRLSRRGHGLVG